jgi:hypothetical protein
MNSVYINSFFKNKIQEKIDKLNTKHNKHLSIVYNYETNECAIKSGKNIVFNDNQFRVMHFLDNLLSREEK